jgi:hypothetical protein
VITAAGEAQPLPYTPWTSGEFRWRLGMRPLDLDDWIQIGEDYEAQMAAKARARARHPETVFVGLPIALPACAELLELLSDHLISRWPAEFMRTATHVINRRTGERLPLDGTVHPLEVAGRLVQEDLIVMVRDPHDAVGPLVFGAGSVCFPNRWDLHSKLGRTMTEVHAPVSRLNEQLGDPIERFFERLQPDKSFWRVGWGVIDTPELFQPPQRPEPARGVGRDLDDLHVRIERETLRRLPCSQAIVFTIRTYIATARRLLATSPDDARRLADAVAAMPSDVRRYKQLDVLGPVLDRLLTSAAP